MSTQAVTPSLYGLLAEFDTADTLLAAAQQVKAAGYAKTDAFSPFPIHGLAEAIGFEENKVAPIILAGGIFGCLAGFGLCYYCQAVAYPMNIGGRPYYSWVAWIPPTFEITILCAVLSAVVGMLALNGLPHPYHPVFNAPRFEHASRDGFFLLVEASDPKFDRHGTAKFLEGLRPSEVVTLDE